MEEDIKKYFENFSKTTVPLPEFITIQLTEKTRLNVRGNAGELICPELHDGYTGEEFIIDKNEAKNYWELLPIEEDVNGYVYLFGEWIKIKTK